MISFHGEFASADASALTEPNSRIALYGARGGSAAAIDANDVVIVTDISISSAGTNLTVSIYDGADATPEAGELLFKGVIPTNTTHSKRLTTPHQCAKGKYPKVKTSGAGQVDILVHGTLERIGS